MTRYILSGELKAKLLGVTDVATVPALPDLSRERQCGGCGCWVDVDLLDAEGFGPDCQTQDGGSRCS
jgi:hypothetical protein